MNENGKNNFKSHNNVDIKHNKDKNNRNETKKISTGRTNNARHAGTNIRVQTYVNTAASFYFFSL